MSEREITYTSVAQMFTIITKMAAENMEVDPDNLKVVEVFDWLIENDYVEGDFMKKIDLEP